MVIEELCMELKAAYDMYHKSLYNLLAPLSKEELEALLNECRANKNQFGQTEPWASVVGSRIVTEIALRKMGFKEEHPDNCIHRGEDI